MKGKVSSFTSHFEVGNMEGNQLTDRRRFRKNDKDSGNLFSNEKSLQQSTLKVSSMEQNGVVIRQESSSSLCSWNSFDASLTDDNSSETDDVAIDDDDRKTDGLNMNQVKKVLSSYCFVSYC